MTALVAGGMGALAATRGDDGARRCFPQAGSSTLLANSDARVYEVFRGYAKNANAFRTAMFACRYKTGRSILLGTTWQTGDENVGNDKLRYIRSVTLSRATPVVGYVDTNCLGHPCRSHVVLRALTDGRVIRRFEAGGPFDSLSLTRDSQNRLALAWLETSGNGPCEAGCRVHLVKRSGDRVLDEGPDIDPDSFGRVDTSRPGRPCCSDGDSFFVWKRGGVLKSASFDD
ncbi:MAG TPA: hypothetical protein VJT75_11975 [Thermoleophilaceae bacterium]|nr:hypothetical protein [Thermoleophilaceae bacterium]